MSRYKIKFNYKASIIVTVEGNFADEGQALEQARKIAEDEPIQSFTLGDELESNILPN